jgi:DNA polymerase I-like protein with 3'-5' exonuclease and polymerase domains
LLIIWSAAKAEILREALDGPFSRIDVMPPHRVCPYEEGEMCDADPGDVVLAMGSKPLSVLQAHRIIPKGRTVDSTRQKAVQSAIGCTFLTTLDPFMVRTRADAPSIIAQDAALAVRVAKTGSTEPVLGEYRYVDNFDEMCTAIWKKIQAGEHVEVAGDLETIGLYPEDHGARIVTAQFSYEVGKSDVYYVPASGKPSDVVMRQIRWLHTCDKILMMGANYKFDLRWMRWHWGLDCTNFSCDNLLVASMLDENRSNSLKALAWSHTSKGGYDRLDELGYDKGEMHLIPKDVLLPYAGCDTDVTLESGRKLKKEITNEGVTARMYRRIVHPASRAFELMEHEGIVVDVEEMGKLRHEISDEIASLEDQMFAMMPGRLKMKYADNLSITRPALLKDFFFSPLGLNLKPLMATAKSGEPSTAKAHLMMFHEHQVAAPFVELLTRHGSASKTRSTFIDGFLTHLRPDGRFHPSYFLFNGSAFGGDDDDAGTRTGRTSAKAPAIQTLPKKTLWAKKLRACYPAPPGHVILQLDFSQGELKIVACVADERNMIAAFKSGLDLHCVTAAAFMNLTYDEFKALEHTDPFTYDLMRIGAKAGNFGLLYGMQVNGFREYARVTFGFSMTQQEAEDRRNTFLYDLYPGLTQYHADAVSYTKQHGYIESPLGRRRHLPLIHCPDQKERSEAERQCINAPIQSTLNDLTFKALIDMQAQLPQLRFFAMIHDALYAYVPEDQAEDLARKAIDVMSNLPIKKELGWAPELQLTADGELGAVLSKMKKVPA